MKKGNIVLVSFPFTDFSSEKIRPALVLYPGSLDVIVAFISTQMHRKEQTDIELAPTLDNGLKRQSIVRLSKLATIDKKMVRGLLGNINSKSLAAINTGLKEIFQLP